jgi:hypothetical protein
MRLNKEKAFIGPDCKYRGVASTPRNVVYCEQASGHVGAIAERQDLRNHSPTGFSWGYGGSGPAQTALAILAHYTHDDELALELYQTFKGEVVVNLTAPNFELEGDVVGTWLLAHGYSNDNFEEQWQPIDRQGQSQN